MTKKNAGFSLIGVTVTSVIAAILMLALGRMVMTHLYAARGIQSSFEISEIAWTTRLLIANSNVCKKTTLIGVDVTPLLSGPDASVPVSLTLPNSSGGVAISIAAGNVFGGVRSVAQVSLRNLTNVVGTEYLLQLVVETALVGRAITSPRSKLSPFSIPVTLDSSNRIVACGGAGEKFNLLTHAVSATPRFNAYTTLQDSITVMGPAVVNLTAIGTGVADIGNGHTGWTVTWNGSPSSISMASYQLKLKVYYTLNGVTKECSSNSNHQYVQSNEINISANCTVLLTPGTYNVRAVLSNDTSSGGNHNHADVSTFRLESTIMHFTQ